ncbi:hypothetical protein INT43_000439 [Umbelopsis isabellina]|uniref:Leo1-like protein n=1 Tax=Mortierella isabellina TaxID=91625 RepID=A0A8H7Q3B1_MORIS|nr:hypothetical protein INT43_000439 [Umbelopsis isabellina]
MYFNCYSVAAATATATAAATAAEITVLHVIRRAYAWPRGNSPMGGLVVTLNFTKRGSQSSQTQPVACNILAITSTKMDDLFGSDDDQQSELNDTPSPTEAHAQSNTRVGNEDESHSAAIDDLFGSDESDSEAKPARKRRVLSDNSESDQEAEEKLNENDMDAQEGDEEDDRAFKRQRIEVELTMPELPLPSSKDDKFHLAKLPKFLDIEPTPFNPETFDPSEEGEMPPPDIIRRQVESTMRWRQVVDENGKLATESNARLIEWEDGTMSLLLGSEYFDVNVKPMSNEEHHYLLAHQTSSGILESHLKFTNNMVFRPSDLKSDTHRNLTAQIADKHVKKTRTKMFMTEQDPELVKQEAEMAEQERLRAKRKLESSRRRAEDRYSYDRPLRYEYEDEEVGGAGGRDEYDEDFVVDDDIVEEEEEEKERRREERLSNLKKSGMDKYRRRGRADEDEDEEDDDDEEEEEEEEEEDDEADLTPEEEDRISSRKAKRRQVLSDEED